MATAPSHRDSSGEPISGVDWSFLRYGNAAVSIRDGAVFFSEDDGVGHDEIIMRVWFYVSTLSSSSSSSSSLIWQKRPVTCADLTMSLLSHLHADIPNEILGRPDLDDVGGYADFLADSVGCFAQDYVRRFFRSAAVAAYHRNLRVDMIEFEVYVLMDETDVPRKPQPQLQKVAYEEEGEGSPAVQETACAICLLDFVKGEEVDVTPCGHPFHPSCLGRWLEQKPSCPLCRTLVPFQADLVQ